MLVPISYIPCVISYPLSGNKECCPPVSQVTTIIPPKNPATSKKLLNEKIVCVNFNGAMIHVTPIQDTPTFSQIQNYRANTEVEFM